MTISLQQLPFDIMLNIASYLKPSLKCYIDLTDGCDGDEFYGSVNSPKRFQQYEVDGLLSFATTSRYLHAVALICTASKDWSVAQATLERGYSRQFTRSFYQSETRTRITGIPKLRGDHLGLGCAYANSQPWREGGNLNALCIQCIEEFLQNNDTNTGTLVIENYRMHTSMERIASALRNNTTVSGLILPQNCITREEAILLAENLSLQENSAIEEIDLSNPNAMKDWFINKSPQNQAHVREEQFNKIDDVAAIAIVHAVIAKPKFKVLDLRGNLISTDCAAHLTARMQAAGKTLLI